MRAMTSLRRGVANPRGVLGGVRDARSLPAAGGGNAGGPPAPGPLTTSFESHTDGPGLWKWRHYFPVYERHLARFVGQEVHIVEVGVFSGGSLEMWKEYFGPGARIYGV